MQAVVPCLLLLHLALLECATTTLYPSTITASVGSFSPDQPITVLTTQDQSGTSDNYDAYIQLNSASTLLTVDLTFNIPSTISVASISGLSFSVNFCSSTKSVQKWNFSVKSGGSYVTFMDNTRSASWVWTLLSGSLSGSASQYVSNSVLTLRISSASVGDDALLDFVALTLTTGSTSSTPSSTPSPTPSSTPSSTPSPTPSSTPSSTPSTTPSSTPSPPPAATTWWKPKPGVQWQWNINSATIDMSFNVPVYDIDLFIVSAATIQQLKAAGRKVICYFSAGSYEDFRPDISAFPASVLGNAICKTGSCTSTWAGERWLDVRQLDTLGKIMGARLDMAVQKGCDGVEPDNMDSFDNNPGFPSTAADQIAYNKLIAKLAHDRGLSVGLKNDLQQIPDLVNDFDWALNEECYEMGECDTLLPFVQANKAVFICEYTGSPATFCPLANAAGFSAILKDYDLSAPRTGCEAYKKRSNLEIEISRKRDTQWVPSSSQSWQIQLDGIYDTSVDADLFDIDLFDSNPKMIRYLHQQGKYVICHFSAGTLENWRPDIDLFPSEIVGDVVPGANSERWLDVTNPLLLPLMISRISLARAKNCDGVTLDSMDLSTMDPTPFTITNQDMVSYAQNLTSTAKALGLRVGLTNSLELANDYAPLIDYIIVEDCYKNNECNVLSTAGFGPTKPVFGIEYSDTMEYCPDAIAHGWNFLKKRPDLDIYRVSCNSDRSIEIQTSGDKLSVSTIPLQDSNGINLATLAASRAALTDSGLIIPNLLLRYNRTSCTFNLKLSPGDTLHSPVTVCLTPKTNATDPCLLRRNETGAWNCVSTLAQKANLLCAQTTALGELVADSPTNYLNNNAQDARIPPPDWLIPVVIACAVLGGILVVVGYIIKKKMKHSKIDEF